MERNGSVCLRIAQVDPHKIALRQRNAELTYSELNRRANVLAAHLAETGLRPSAAVGICMERSFDWVIAALAVMRAGAAYVAMDATWPVDRIRYLLRDSGASHLIARNGLLQSLNADVVGIDPQRLRPGDSATSRQPELHINPINPEELAYIIYTSGTSGYPKGVEITHGNLEHLVDWHLNAFQVTEDDRASHLAGLSFDAAAWEVWPYLAAGSSISLIDEPARSSPELLQQWLLSERITISYVPTALVLPLAHLSWPADAPLRFMLTGGEKLLRPPQGDLPFVLVNNYGPTECTVVSTSGVVDWRSSADPSIGKAIENVSIYLLDEHGSPVPQGTPGEIYIAGAGVGRGYRNQPELTAKSFVPDPFSTQPGARMYRTGDLGILSPSGEIEFHGRVDLQEKIRGHRIELEEISSVLCRHAKVKFATVQAISDEAGEKRLIAYVLPMDGHAPTSTELQRFLADTLPSYMLPAAFVQLQSLPLSNHGKIDKTQLPAPVAASLLPATADASAEINDPVCQRLLGMVRELLKTNAVRAQDDFFLVGGHSLLGTQLILRIRAAFRVDISLLDLFEARTVLGLAEKIEALLLAEVSAMSEEEARRQVEASL